MAKTKRKAAAAAPAANAGPSTFRNDMRRLIGERWTEVWRTIPEAIAGESIEGVHDVRVASRRLRAAMDVAVDCFPRSWYRPLHSTAKHITSALGDVRDRDVLIEALMSERAAAAAAERPGIDGLIARIETERAEFRRQMESFLSELLAGPIPAATTRRFGAVAPPRSEEDGPHE